MNCWCGSPREGSVCLGSKYHDPLATGEPKDIRRIYVAGPMSNLPENNYPAFNSAAKALREKGFEVVNPAEFGAEGASSYVDLLREDLRRLLDCDAVATLDGWWFSNGARNEVSVADTLSMPVRPVHEWIG